MTDEEKLQLLQKHKIKREVILGGQKFIKIDKIQLNNFRFFRDDEKHNTFELNGKNMLLYGENGSGKSSLYKAFELLSNIGKQSVREIFEENKNIFKREEDDFSFVKFDFNNDTYLEINDGQSQQNSLDFIKNLSVFKPLLDYRELLEVVNIKEANLYHFFENILDEYPISEDKVLRTLREKKDKAYFTKFENILKEELFSTINHILAQFQQSFTIKEIDFDAGFHTIYLKIEYFNTSITKYQLFLNEARLSALAMSVYFAIIKKQFSLLNENSLKILVLDDLLISLDMSNKQNLINILKTEFSDFQIFFFTHDKWFFEILKKKMDWKPFEMYVDDSGDFEKPFINKESLSYLEKAEKYFYLHDYEIAGTFLRKEAESFCKDFLPKKLHYGSECNLRDLNGLILKCIDFAKNAGLDDTLFKELDTHRKFVLNPTSHDNHDVPKYKSEIKSALDTLKALRAIRNEAFLKRGDIVEFELTTPIKKKVADTYKFEIKLEDDFRLLTIDGQDTVISKGMINYWVSKNGKRDKVTKSDNTTLEKFYEYNYKNSNKVKSADYWKEIIIQESGKNIEMVK